MSKFRITILLAGVALLAMSVRTSATVYTLSDTSPASGGNLVTSFTTGTVLTATTRAVPEPTPVVLLGLGLWGLGLARRRNTVT